MRKYGREDAVFFYNKNIEVDFYIPEELLAIQVCYDLDNSDGTFDREVESIIKITKVLECKRLLIITRDSVQTLEIAGKTINVIPVWKWLLNC